jgi:hypothetical protein
MKRHAGLMYSIVVSVSLTASCFGGMDAAVELNYLYRQLVRICRFTALGLGLYNTAGLASSVHTRVHEENVAGKAEPKLDKHND